ncbi:MAG: HAMP domain-containing sensor histidine kinase [Jiangellales bacterium]
MTGRLFERRSLRTQLVMVVLLLSAFTVVATSVVAAVLLRAQLIDQVDDSLQQAARPVVDGLARGDLPPPQPPDDDNPFRRTEFSVTVLDEAGAVVAQQMPSSTELGDPILPALDDQSVARYAGAPFTVEADGGGSWRVLVVATGDGSVVLALPLTTVQQTLQQLVLLDVALALAALVVLAVVARWAVSARLRPLLEVEETAQAIADGDLAQRVPDYPATTEVGRLSASLNTMLGQIEEAVTDQQRAAREAQASEARMRRFVADASHELRTPLTSIRGFAELYRQGAVQSSADLDQTMRRIEDEAHRMGLLVEDLLLLARLDQQRPVQQEPVDLVRLATEVVQDASVLSSTHPVTMQVPAEPRTATVVGDDARLRQVLSNLVRNALTHTPDGTAVRVGVVPRGDQVTLTVSDDGPGMAPADAQRAFERFYRADASRSRSRSTSSGSGLGLSIVAALVAAHGGTVELATAEHQGTTVTVQLPALDGAQTSA